MSKVDSSTNLSESQQAKGYRGPNCSCQACSLLSEEERAAKWARIQASRSQGGKTRSAQPSMKEARSAGFWSTMERHPLYARNHLKAKIKRQNTQRARKVAMRVLIVGQVQGRRRPMK